MFKSTKPGFIRVLSLSFLFKKIILSFWQIWSGVAITKKPISLNTDIFADFSENTLDLSNDNEEESETELNESKSVEDLDLRLSESELEWALRKIHEVEKILM